jgi:hypothetical protein
MADPSISDAGKFFTTAGLYGDANVAGSGTDNAERTCPGVDRLGFGSAKLVVSGRTDCAAGQTVKVTAKIADADDNGSGSPGAYGSDTTLESAVTIVDGAGSAQVFTHEYDIDLTAYKQWLQFKLTVDMSDANTKVCNWSAVLVLGGARVLPATAN